MATRQKYERLKKTIIKEGEPTQVTITSREMKSTIAKAYGISFEDVDKKYYLFRNRLLSFVFEWPLRPWTFGQERPEIARH